MATTIKSFTERVADAIVTNSTVPKETIQIVFTHLDNLIKEYPLFFEGNNLGLRRLKNIIPLLNLSLFEENNSFISGIITILNSRGQIIINKNLERDKKRETIAHEIGHWILKKYDPELAKTMSVEWKEEHANFFCSVLLDNRIFSKTTSVQSSNDIFLVNPLNNIVNFPHYNIYDENDSWIKEYCINLESNSCKSPRRKIELIQCKSGNKETILQEIDDRGFISAPTEYVAGLGLQPLKSIQKYGQIFSLDKSNLIDEKGNDYFMYLEFVFGRTIELIGCNAHFGNNWWFAVIEKEDHQKII